MSVPAPPRQEERGERRDRVTSAVGAKAAVAAVESRRGDKARTDVQHPRGRERWMDKVCGEQRGGGEKEEEEE